MAKPIHEQGQLQLQLYDLRRETKLRQAREWFFQNYHVKSLDDAMRIAAPGTENGMLAMMVFIYWDQACARAFCTKSCFLRPAASFLACGSSYRTRYPDKSGTPGFRLSDLINVTADAAYTPIPPKHSAPCAN
jgi:hypothetical protein